jgi:Protein of unknown function (DUF992)
LEPFSAADVYRQDHSKQELDMLRGLTVLSALALGVAVAMPTSAMAQVANHTKIGTLTCDISAGIGVIIASKKNLTCMFTPAQPGPREVYVGEITKFGLDLGATTGGEMLWTVYAPSNRRFGALAGHYVGATAEATVGAGVGANVLVGGSNRTIALQPVSVQAQTGLNVAAGVAGLELQPAR